MIYSPKAVSLGFFVFFSSYCTHQAEKNVQKTPHSVTTCIVGPHKCKQGPIVQFCANWVMVIAFISGRKTLQMHGFPI